MTEFSSAPIGGAFRAYQNAQAMPAAKTSGIASAPGPAFSELLEQTARDTIETVREGDRAGIMGLQGKMSTQDVVEATMAMETALKTTVAIRDRMVEAYQEVLRMAV